MASMVTLVADDPPGLPIIVRRDEALASGLTRDQIRHRVRGGHWRRMATGVYLRVAPADGQDAFESLRIEHMNRAVAAFRARPDCVIGFGSAAIMHGLPLITGVPSLVQLLVPEGSWTGIRSGVRYRACQLGREDETPGAVRVTSPTRTWIDIARTHRLPDALSSGDRAISDGRLIVDDATWALSQLGSIRGVRLAARALPLLDGLRETPLESWSFAAFVSWNIPLPTMQREVFDDDGLIGRVDFYWPEHRLVGESDGRLKYEAKGALYEEKRREDRLRAMGLSVVRWGWSDLARDQEALRTRLTTTLLR